ncbi:MAG: DUF4838 domain-containing protein [Victivallales bacterium]|nr:DUF4838 domain-containing protein [Victivallales bacterium]
MKLNNYQMYWRRISLCLVMMVLGKVAVNAGLNNPALNKIRLEKQVNGSPIDFVKNGKANATVIIPAAPQTTEDKTGKMSRVNAAMAERAAMDLVKYVKAVSGAELKIIDDTQALPKGNVILIGESRYSREKGVSAAELPLEGFRIQAKDNYIAIVGRLPGEKENFMPGVESTAYTVKNSASMGTLFGVYDFLERFCGVRWYYPGELGCYIPERRDLSVPSCAYSDWPEFTKRTATIWKMNHMENKELANSHKTREAFSPFFRAGDSSYIDWGVHSPRNFKVHFKQHPECFSLFNSGERDPEYPCYGNPKTLELMLDDVKRYYRDKDKNAFMKKEGKTVWCPPSATRIIVSPPDKPVHCSCEYCRKWIDPSAPYFKQANRLMAKFTKDFALAAEKEFPGKKILYVPYSNYVECPDGLQFPENVVMMLCLTFGAGNLKEDHARQYSGKLISEWFATNKNPLFLWEYACWPANNTLLPYQYPQTIQRLYRENRGMLGGSFINGGGQPGTDTTPGGEWAYFHPTYYNWFRLMWNNDYDVDASMDEYCRLMYGPAAPAMRELFNILSQRWEQVKWQEKLSYHQVDPAKIHRETMPKEQVNKLKSLLAEAENKAGKDNLTRKRVDFFGNALKNFFAESDSFHSPDNLTALWVMKVAENPVLDGKISDPCWKQAKEYSLQYAYSKDIDKVRRTRMKAVWTDSGITFGIRAFTHFPVTGRYKEHDDPIYNDESIEIFIAPGDGYNFYQVAVNVLNGMYDGKDRDGKFNFKGIKTAVYVREDLNWWTAEVFIPFSELGVKPEIGLEMKGNIVRTNIGEKNNKTRTTVYRLNTKYRSSHADYNAFAPIILVE